ncbi:MAG: P-II family nitrogen regulator [Acholeplasmatales bacterium]|nr:P-II family nitrogen regulator [Acholeplasmatales bacterium]
MSNEYELILCIVNQGFSEEVMDAAKDCGARGGTVINARGTAKADAEALFHITISPEKEIVMILSKVDIKDDILKAIYTKVGLNSPGQGIAFSVPVDDVVGLGAKNIDIEKLKEKEKK